MIIWRNRGFLFICENNVWTGIEWNPNLGYEWKESAKNFG